MSVEARVESTNPGDGGVATLGIRQQYDQAVAAFGKAIEKYFADMNQDSFRRTDEVGYTKSMYDAKGPRP